MYANTILVWLTKKKKIKKTAYFANYMTRELQLLHYKN